jgi:hypothetical protein
MEHTASQSPVNRSRDALDLEMVEQPLRGVVEQGDSDEAIVRDSRRPLGVRLV